MAPLPVINLEPSEVKEIFWTKVKEPQSQRKLILVIVSIALLLDNMLYMVIVPIIPDYLRYIGTWGPEEPYNMSAPTTVFTPHTHAHHGQDTATGILFASKAIVQLMVNPFSGALIDRIGYDLPMMVGLIIMFLSTMVFACGRSYSMLFFARSLQGVGSAFADTSGLAMIADRFTEEAERTKALGIALAFISFGCLVAPPFGGALYQFAGKEVPFVILALISLMDGFMLLLVMKPIKETLAERHEVKPPSVPIWRLLMDPYIAVCAGALMMSNVALAFLEPTISLWMEDNLTTDNWKIGMVWLPAFFPHVLGVVITVKMARQYPEKQWIMAAGGLALEGLCCFIIPFSTSYIMLMIPICGICFGIALIDTALLPTLGYLVDIRYVSVYGSIYAIADISYSMAYAIGPIIAGGVVEAIGFTALNFLIAFSNLLYAPVLGYLRNIYDFKHFENEANILMGDPPTKEYQTYTMHDQQAVGEEYKNHLEYGRQTDEGNYQQETNIDQGYSQNGSYQQQQQQGGYQNYQPGYQEQGGNTYQQQQQQQQGPRHLPQQPQQQVANPFRHGESSGQQQQQQQQQQPSQSRVSNPFRQGWKDSILQLPKKWLSTSEATDEFGFPQMLPKVPVPTLEQTTTEYLRVLQPIVTAQQLERTRSIIRQFNATIGPTLQEYLVQKRESEENWAYHYWLNDMYMDNPLPLPINSNPGMVMPPRRFTTVHDLAQFGAQLIDQLMDHKEMLESGVLKQERATSREKGQPLCMAQYYRLLGSCRRPGDPRDSQYLPPSGEQTDAHVIVTCRKHMYCLAVKAGDRDRLTEAELAAQLLHVLNEAPCLPESESAVGILTTEPRPRWAADREMLLLDERNARNIELIETALVLICVDEPLPLTYNARGFNGSPAGAHYAGGRDESNMAHEMIHGGGSSCNTANRWFDKTMQLIICSDGSWGLCYEHSPSEGIAVVQLLEGILRKIDEGPVRDGAGEPLPVRQSSHLPPPERLEWVVRPEIEGRLREVARSVDRRIEDLDFYVYRYKPYGKNFIKACQVSPDVFIQLALQLAYYKLYGHLVSTYESASTRRFRLGRVDCIRSASTEALEWAKAMCQGEGPNVTLESDKEDDYSAEASGADVKKRDHLRELFRCAAARQTEVMVQNILGYGIDIHLLGLREACREREGTMHELFTDECYKIANCFLLSTSQVACSTNSFMGYGPVTPHGYGASYNPHPNEIIFCISAFFTSDKTSASRFARSLQDSLDAMRDLLS